MSQNFTSGSTYFKIAPDYINNPISFRLSIYFKNVSLASKISDKIFIYTMVDNVTVTRKNNIPILDGCSDRARSVASNYVVIILGYKNLINNLLKNLIGIEKNSNKRKDQYYMQKLKDVFGIISWSWCS